MTTLYRPVELEDGEQADALPDGTMAFDGDDRVPYFKHDGQWRWAADGGIAPRDMTGCTALVPIEAEEETAPDLVAHNTHAFRQELDLINGVPPRPYDGPMRTRYVTPWQAAE